MPVLNNQRPTRMVSKTSLVSRCPNKRLFGSCHDWLQIASVLCTFGSWDLSSYK